MGIKGKLFCAFLIITIMPISLLAGVFGILYNMQTGVMEKYGVAETTVEDFISNPVQIINQVTNKDYKELQNKVKEQVLEMENADFLDAYNKQLLWKFSYLVVRKDGEYIYIGDENDFHMLEEDIPSSASYDNMEEVGVYMGGENAHLLKPYSFTFADGREGTFFIVTYINGFFPVIRSTVLQFVLSFMVIICFTAILLILWVYGGIVRPINVLKQATHKMRDGDLNFSVYSNSSDEIGMLCKDFEEMRIRLKESIDLRLRYEQEMREMISNISHDLKTPLTAIEGYTEGIIDGVANTPEKQKKYLDTIHRKAKAMSALVDDLSMASKIENGIVPYVLRRVKVLDFFDDCIQEIGEDLRFYQIKLIYENTVGKQLRVEVDPEQIKRVINNLVGNAIKYMGEDPGCVCLYVKEIEESMHTDYKIKEDGKGIFGKKMKYKEEKKMPKIQIEIKDNGRGISKEDLPNIFNRFYRGDASRHSWEDGSGLGLAIAKKIVEEHGGNIWANSEVGVGTSVFFTIPVFEEKQEEVYE